MQTSFSQVSPGPDCHFKNPDENKSTSHPASPVIDSALDQLKCLGLPHSSPQGVKRPSSPNPDERTPQRIKSDDAAQRVASTTLPDAIQREPDKLLENSNSPLLYIIEGLIEHAKLLLDAQETSIHDGQEEVKPKTVTQIINYLERAWANLKRHLELHKQAFDHPSKSTALMETVICSYVRTGYIDRAVEMFTELEGIAPTCLPSRYSIRTIRTYCANEGDIEGFIRFLKLTRDKAAANPHLCDDVEHQVITDDLITFSQSVLKKRDFSQPETLLNTLLEINTIASCKHLTPYLCVAFGRAMQLMNIPFSEKLFQSSAQLSKPMIELVRIGCWCSDALTFDIVHHTNVYEAYSIEEIRACYAQKGEIDNFTFILQMIAQISIPINPYDLPRMDKAESTDLLTFSKTVVRNCDLSKQGELPKALLKIVTAISSIFMKKSLCMTFGLAMQSMNIPFEEDLFQPVNEVFSLASEWVRRGCWNTDASPYSIRTRYETFSLKEIRARYANEGNIKGFVRFLETSIMKEKDDSERQHNYEDSLITTDLLNFSLTVVKRCAPQELPNKLCEILSDASIPDVRVFLCMTFGCAMQTMNIPFRERVFESANKVYSSASRWVLRGRLNTDPLLIDLVTSSIVYSTYTPDMIRTLYAANGDIEGFIQCHTPKACSCTCKKEKDKILQKSFQERDSSCGYEARLITSPPENDHALDSTQQNAPDNTTSIEPIQQNLLEKPDPLEEDEILFIKDFDLLLTTVINNCDKSKPNALQEKLLDILKSFFHAFTDEKLSKYICHAFGSAMQAVGIPLVMRDFDTFVGEYRRDIDDVTSTPQQVRNWIRTGHSNRALTQQPMRWTLLDH